MNKKLIFLAMPIFILALSMVLVGCASAPATPREDITITVTGDFSEYNGWEANMAVGDDAFAMPLRVGASTASLTFTILRMDNNKPFNTPGAYMVVFWFKKAGEADADYVLMSKTIKEGSNSIEFSTFSPL
jgi:hypothetical protein